MPEKKTELPADREVDARGHCSKCGGLHYGNYMCPFTHRDEVMNPPASAAQDAEARNLNTSQRHGTGAVPQGEEAQATQPLAAPEPPYLVRAFWSPDRRYLVTVHVTAEGIIALQDDNGLEWEPSGPQQDVAARCTCGSRTGHRHAITCPLVRGLV